MQIVLKLRVARISIGMTSRPLPSFPPHPYLARNERLKGGRERRLREDTTSWRGNVKMRQTLGRGEHEERKGREESERREMKRNLASTATEGWFTAVSGFLASYLQDHPSRASLPSKTKRDRLYLRPSRGRASR